ncbi:9886_t:CDS:1, partial [Funneliformis caledonium]
ITNLDSNSRYKPDIKSNSLFYLSTTGSARLRSNYRFNSTGLENWGTSSKNRRSYQSYIIPDSENKDNDDAKSLI